MAIPPRGARTTRRRAGDPGTRAGGSAPARARALAGALAMDEPRFPARRQIRRRRRCVGFEADQPLMKIAVRPAFAALLGAVCLLAVPASASAGAPAGFVDTFVSSGLTRATAMAWDPNTRLFVLEQGGTVRVI